MSTHALALAKGALKALAAGRCKGLALWLLTFSVLTAGLGVSAFHLGPTPPLDGPERQPPPLASRTDRSGDPLPPGARARMGTIRLRPGIEVSALVFSPDGKMLASAPIFTNRIQLWDLATGKPVAELSGHRAAIVRLRFTPDGKTLASGSIDHTIRIWDLTKRKEIRQIPIPWNGSFALSPDGRTLAASNDDQCLHLWDVTSGQDVRTLRVEGEAAPPHGHMPTPLAFSPDGKTLVEDRDCYSFRLWDVATGKPLRTIRTEVFGNNPQAVAFTPRGLMVVSADLDGPYNLWKADEGGRVTLADRPSLEVRHRVEQLLARLERPELPPEQLRRLRALEALERSATPEAGGRSRRWARVLRKTCSCPKPGWPRAALPGERGCGPDRRGRFWRCAGRVPAKRLARWLPAARVG